MIDYPAWAHWIAGAYFGAFIFPGIIDRYRAWRFRSDHDVIQQRLQQLHRR